MSFFCSPSFALGEALRCSMVKSISKIPYKAVYVRIYLDTNPHILHWPFLRLVNDHGASWSIGNWSLLRDTDI